MKQEKFAKLVQEVEEFIAEHEMKSMHYLYDEEVIAAFSEYKKKHVKLALEEVR